jgi:Notch-like protein
MKFFIAIALVSFLNIQFIAGQGCANSPCQNKGLCVEKGNDFICQCPPGFYGDLCQTISYCASHTCRNGGRCSNDLTIPAGYSCTCATG